MPLYNPTQAPTRGALFGLTLSNNVATPASVLDIAAGACTDYLGDTAQECAAMSKNLAANWSAGSGNGFRYSGAAIANTTYHIFAAWTPAGIADFYAYPGAGEATALAALNAEPGGADYAYIRRIGAILREAGSIAAFLQRGPRFLRASPATDFNGNVVAAAQLVTLSIPSGVSLVALVAVRSFAANNHAILLSCPDLVDLAPSVNGPFSGSNASASSIAGPYGQYDTNNARQVRARATTTMATVLVTLGWLDDRGMSA